MKKYFKAVVLTTTLLFIAGCDSGASSDAKSVVVKKVAPVSETIKVDTKPTQAQASEFVEGKHYVEIFPEMQTDATTGKVEVLEMVWLGCPHCYALEPTMMKYKNNHPDFVEFKQVPAMLNPSWSADATTFYLAEILDSKGDKQLITKVFQAIHEQKRRLRGADSVKRFFTQLGFTSEQVDNAQNSMAFRAKIKRAQEISASSQANSVPTIIINGKYRTSPYMAGSEDKLMRIIDMLTKRENNK